MNILPLPFSKRDYIIRGLSVLLYWMVLLLIFSAISFFSSSFVLFLSSTSLASYAGFLERSTPSIRLSIIYFLREGEYNEHKHHDYKDDNSKDGQ